MKSLTIIASIPTIGIEILSDQRWIDKGRTHIIDMEDDHLRNAVLWAYRQWKTEEGAKLAPAIVYGFTYRQWYMILKEVYDKRIEKQEQEEKKQITRLYNEVEAKTTTETYSRSERTCYGSDNRDEAFESMLGHFGY